MKEMLAELAMVEGDLSTMPNQRNRMTQDGQENVVFEIKALHLISKAVKGDYTHSDFMNLNERTGPQPQEY
ncbi:hypothetical protein V6N13_030893 [Hibiscus sabdariffa]|uniref:Uncharacterized protein n=2 Tax=Hibiscus sabdariffa TaxID=183260 RepID=A0ABR1ZWG8_9ROSI